MMSVKNLDLKLVTADTSKLDVLNYDWDCFQLLQGDGARKHYMNSTSAPTTENAGINRVLKQTSDLTKNYKFNKIKL
jgi:hypothetical protein